MSLDNTIWLAGIVTEAVVVGLLVFRQVWRVVPFFCVYCVWDLLSNVVGFMSIRFSPGTYNVQTYLIATVIDSALQFGVLVELALSVLRPLRQSLPRFTPIVIGALILALGVLIWPFASLPGLAQYSVTQQLLGHLQQAVSILRVLFFLLLAASSQWLSIGWRDRELQVATGLGFYSLVSLAAAMLATHESTGLQFFHLNQIVVASFLCSLLYWVISFVQKQAERREFTPQMQNLLLAVAGAARASRAALSDPSVTNVRIRRKRG
jgi:hypothetical protein